MARQIKSETKLSEAADKATALLQGLQSRLNVPRPESPEEDLDRQLREYFVAESGKFSEHANMLDQIRERVIDAVADRMVAARCSASMRFFATSSSFLRSSS